MKGVPDPIRRLPNGLRVVLVDEPGSGFVAVLVRYGVGACDDPPGRPGLAHLVEHLLFTGSRHTYRGDYDGFLAGAQALDVNATTAADATTYRQVVPRENLERILWLESDRMGFMTGQIRAGELELSRRIVDGELRQKLRNDPRGVSYRALWNAAFPAPHPYFEPEDASPLRGVTVADVEAFLRTYYGPGNAIMVLVGALPADADARVERYFGDLPGGPAPTRAAIGTSPLRGEARIELPSHDRRPRVTVAWPSPSLLAPGDAEADLLAAMLRQNLRDRLWPRDGTTLALALQHSRPGTSMFVVEALGRPGDRAAAVLAAIDGATERLARGDWEDLSFVSAHKALRVGVLHRRSGLLERAFAVAADRPRSPRAAAPHPVRRRVDPPPRRRRVRDPGVRAPVGRAPPARGAAPAPARAISRPRRAPLRRDAAVPRGRAVACVARVPRPRDDGDRRRRRRGDRAPAARARRPQGRRADRRAGARRVSPRYATPAATASASRGYIGEKPRSSRRRRPSITASKARARSGFEPSGGGAPTDANSAPRSGASSSQTL